MIILALTLFLGFSLGLPLTILIVIGYREQVRKATEAANRNAGYWAESECKLYDAVISEQDWKTKAHCETKRADDLNRIASQALDVARDKAFSPQPEHFETAEAILAGNDSLADDEILDAGEIG